MYIGKLVPFQERLSVVSLSESEFTCVSCGGSCHTVLSVPKKLLDARKSGEYRVVRCLNCIFWGPYYVYFVDNVPIKVVPPAHYECHHFLEDQCERGSKASIEWIDVLSLDDCDNTLTFAGERPRWIQSQEWPQCPVCRGNMEFILQLSSECLDTRQLAPPGLHDFVMAIEYYATLYFFVCGRCQVTCSVTQCD